MDRLPSEKHVQVNGGQEPPEPEGLSTFDELREKAHQSLAQLNTLLKAVKEPLPKDTGNATYLPEKGKEGLWADIDVIFRDLPKLGITSIDDLLKSSGRMKLGEPLNDKHYLMESIIQAAAKLPTDIVSAKITDDLLTTLWNDLTHPPQTLLGDQYQFRQPDGSLNSYQNPQIGAAGMPYARSVPTKVLQPGNLPDPGVLFDTLMARKEPNLHPNRISSMLFYLASIIIHDAFRTDHTDYRLSDTSSYLDLAPLYGSTWKEQKTMRTFKDGKIKPDCFSETRLLSFPPGVGALLIMFNRYHNYVVEQLALINENGRFHEAKKPVNRYGEELNKRDDDLFQTGRLITCGLYINIILIDYVRTILNLNRTDDNWQLNPRMDIPNGPPVGTGNQVSAEFNLVYRWHAAISTRDDAWTQELWGQIFGPNAKDLPQIEVIKTLGHMEADLLAKDPLERHFPALKRETLERIKEGPYKGNFKDDDLAALLTSSIEDCANAFGPQQVPTIMRAIEILGIQQARTWQLATLNEFRKHFGLTPHETFEDITENREVSEVLKHLYDTPDNVELYPGLVVEDAKIPKLPGSGLCPSYTVSRAVLSDAVALVRGDRFYTSSYSPTSLTNWGYQEASSDLTIDNGCVFYKLFLRALPNNYDPSSVYVHYPLTIPGEMHTVLRGLNKDHKYNFDIPKPIPRPTMVFSYAAAKEVFEDPETYKVTWGAAMVFLMGPAAKNFMLSGDDAANAKSRALMEKALYIGGDSRALPQGNEKWLKAVKAYYETTTTKLLQETSYKLAQHGNQVDIIRDVGNLIHVRFAAELFGLPLKTPEFEHGVFTEQQLYLIMAALFISVFFDVDPPKSFPLRQQAYEATQILGQMVQVQVEALKHGHGGAEALISKLHPPGNALRDYGVHMIARLVEQDGDVRDLVWGNIMGTCAGMVANQGQLFGQALDYLFNEGRQHLPRLQELAGQDTDEADDEIMHYFMEFARLNGETGIFRLVGRATTLADGDTTHHLQQGERVMVNIKAANRDGSASAFPNPDAVDLTRPLASYITFGHGTHACLGLPMTRVALATMLKVVCRLPNPRPATVAVGGAAGVASSVKKVTREFVPGDAAKLPASWLYHAFLTEDWDMFFPLPTSLKLNWDAEATGATPAANNAGAQRAGAQWK